MPAQTDASRRSLPLPPPRLAKTIAGLSLIGALLTASLAPASAETAPPVTAEADDCVVISEVNTRGGSGASPYQRYVELENSCDDDVDITGWSVQGYQANGTPYSGGTPQLSGSIPAEGSYLITGSGVTGQAELNYDHHAGNAINVAGANASVVLFTTEPVEVSGDVSGVEEVADAVAWGSGTVGLGSPASAPTTALSLLRTGNTGDNAADFTTGEHTPRYTGGDAVVQDEDDEDPGDSEQHPDAKCLAISEVNTRGGSGAAPFQRYVELENSCETDVDLSEWSLQGYQANGNPYSGNPQLTGSIPAGGHYLAVGNGAAGQQELSYDIDLGGVFNYAGANSSVVLFSSPEPVSVTGDVTELPEVVDALGWGSAAISMGETASSPNPPATLHRVDSTGVNSADFAAGDPSPRYTGGSAAENDDDEEPGEPEDPELVTVAEIRGEPSLDPADADLYGEDVVVRGVITGSYFRGSTEGRGYDGYYLQDPGACGEEEFEGVPEVSCAIFVYSGSWGGAAGGHQFSTGDFVEITGEVTQFNGHLQLDGFTELVEDQEIIDQHYAEVVAFPYSGDFRTEERTALLGMVVEPQGDWTVTDNYGLMHSNPNSIGGWVTLTDGPDPLLLPTSLHHPQSEERASLAASNQERMITLGHGGQTRWTNWAEADRPLPYLRPDSPLRVGAGVDFTDAVVLDHRLEHWMFEPLSTVIGNPEAEPADFENTREQVSLPQREGDLRMASFNVLNYFPHYGELDPTCSESMTYTDIDGNPTTLNGCTSRGAWSQELFEYGEAKVVEAILGMDADLIALQEIENSLAFGQDRDWAHQQLVDAVNSAADTDVWDYVALPEGREHPQNEDVIRNGYLYRTDQLEVVDAMILFEDGIDHLDLSYFDEIGDIDQVYSNAREPFAALFQPLEGTEDDQFAVIVNHLKSKRDDGNVVNPGDEDQGDGAGSYNYTRTLQAEAMVAFTLALEEFYGLDKFYLTGDFNSYAAEDPAVTIENAGYTNLGKEAGTSYVFGGESGSIDHLFASPGAVDTVLNTVKWQINSPEPIALEYTRFNSTGTPGLNDSLETSGGPLNGYWRSSDHDPVISDIALSDGSTDPEEPEHQQWDPSAVYTGGEAVEYDGRLFEALWWTQNQEPGASPWSAWSEIGAPTECDSVTYPAWAASTKFTGGETVVHDSTVYTAKWWTRNQEPGDPWGPWEESGDC
ncbi:ExeM/NucH family extracellular endonuclease [Nesterenkonia muleiensis]|uniref:ExeM/NucH family extracellular endonuclease n=1 Tax=Nesterenkonia muleiensis TaxID=2282648 RepID=UPI000E73F6C8|nr:ExeM/NucH family extracellular endonuclease [Nesterenkonia muleiensis]